MYDTKQPPALTYHLPNARERQRKGKSGGPGLDSGVVSVAVAVR